MTEAVQTEGEAMPETQETEQVSEQVETEVAAKAETTEEATASGQESQPEEKKISGVQKRFNELTREKYEAQQQAEAAQKEIEQMRQREAEMQMQAQMQQLQGQRPTLEAFGYDENQYNQALEQWYGQQFQMQQQVMRDQAEQQQKAYAEQQRQQKLTAKMAEAAVKYPDFQQVVRDPSLPSLAQISPAAYEAVTESEHFDDVAYYLAKNPAEVYAFSQMSPIQAVMKVAEIGMRETSPKPNVTPPPPPPPSEIKGRAEANAEPNPKDVKAWIAWREKQIQR